jgi:RNA polymerase sigma-70 factor (ECF subfamily)
MPRRTRSDEERFDRVYTANFPLILRYAARRCDEPVDAADVAAEVFLVAWRRLERMPDGEERLWLFGIARRVMANSRRARLRRQRLTSRLRDELAAEPVVVEPAGSAAEVLDALRRLPDRDRELLQLAVWDGLSPSEIAAIDHIPAATVRSRLMRARNRLREALAETDTANAQRESAVGHVSDEQCPVDPTVRSSNP